MAQSFLKLKVPTSWYLCGKQTLKRVFSDSHSKHAICRVKDVLKKSTEIVFAKYSLNGNVDDMQSV